MSGWVALHPFPRVDRLPFQFVALTAKRADAGLIAEVQVLNGTARWGNQITLSSQQDRVVSSEAIAATTAVAAVDAASALLELHGLTEVQLRKQAAPPDWQTPLALDPLRALPTFPVECLPAWLRDYVKGVAEFTQTPRDLAAMLGLAILAFASQRFAILEMRENYQEPLCLYILVAMESGERKSAVYRAMARPIFEYEAALVETWQPEIARLQSERRILEKSLDKAIADAAGKDGCAMDRAAAANLAQDLAKLTVPADPVLVIQDSTPESMVQVLAEQGGNLAVLDAEGGLLDTLMGARYSESGPNLDPLLKAHAGDEIRNGRVGRARISIKVPMLTMGIAPQPDVLRGLVDKKGAKKRGLLGRFLYSLPTTMKGSRRQEARTVDPMVTARYSQWITALMKAGEPEKPGLFHERRVVKPSREAYDQWVAFSAWIEPQLGKDGALAGTDGWAEKLAGQVARLASNMHLADGRDPELQATIPLSGHAMARAIRIGTEYLLPHGLTTLRFMEADAAFEDARVIQRWFERTAKQVFTARQAWSDLRQTFARTEDLKPGLSLLIDCGVLIEEDTYRPGPGRKPSPKYLVNPERPSQNTQNTQNTPPPEENEGTDAYAELIPEYAELPEEPLEAVFDDF